MFARYRNHAAWTLLGALAVVGMWFAYALPGAFALFGAIIGAFVFWHFIGPRGSWLALVVVGLTMSGLLGWQAVTSARCPAPGERIIMKNDKPPVTCDELRASAASMSMFFGIVGLIGLAAPPYLRGGARRDDERDDGNGSAQPT